MSHKKSVIQCMEKTYQRGIPQTLTDAYQILGTQVCRFCTVGLSTSQAYCVRTVYMRGGRIFLCVCNVRTRRALSCSASLCPRFTNDRNALSCSKYLAAQINEIGCSMKPNVMTRKITRIINHLTQQWFNTYWQTQSHTTIGFTLTFLCDSFSNCRFAFQTQSAKYPI